MKTRVITAIIFALIIIPVILLGHTLLGLIFFLFVGVVSMFEILRAAGLHKKIGVALPTYLVAVLLPFLVYFGKAGTFFKNCAIVFFLLALWYLVSAVFSKGRLQLQDVAILFLMCLYVLISFNALYALEMHIVGQGKYGYELPFLVAWSTDIFAYLTGKAFGKHKLIPDVSPKKTVEGAIGGLCAGVLAAVIFGFVVRLIQDTYLPNYPALIAVGLVMSLFAMAGDLIASLVKRHYGIKDYGKLLPGHGGILDRFDSVLGAGPVPIILYEVVGLALFYTV